MKNLLFLSALITLPLTVLSKGDEPFQGKITYEITYEGEGAEFLQLVSFAGYDYFFGNQKFRIALTGGMANLMGDFIVDQAKGSTIMINDEEDIAYTMEDVEEETSADEIQVVMSEINEKILGYKCYQYFVTIKTDSSEMTSEYWTTTDILVNSTEEIGLTNSLFVEGLEGFPLKIISHFEGITMTQMATVVSEYNPPSAIFEIPTNYQVKDISESPLMKMDEEDSETE